MEYVSYFDIIKLEYKNLHTMGSILAFDKPTIGYLIKGKGEFLYKGNKYVAKEGDLIYIAKDTKYYSLWQGEPEIEFYSMRLKYTDPYAFYDYRFQIVENFPKEYMDDIYNNKEFKAMSALYLMLDKLYPKMKKTTQNTPSVKISDAIKYIEENWKAEIKIEDLAKLCHISKSSLFQLFKKAAKVSPVEYKHNIMIQNALYMLEHTDFSIEEISEKTGFSSSNYFRTVFKKITGKTPKEIRT